MIGTRAVKMGAILTVGLPQVLISMVSTKQTINIALREDDNKATELSTQEGFLFSWDKSPFALDTPLSSIHTTAIYNLQAQYVQSKILL